MAETSITINDVVFVVDCGKAKETSYDALNNTPCLLPAWISKASARQVRLFLTKCDSGIPLLMMLLSIAIVRHTSSFLQESSLFTMYFYREEEELGVFNRESVIISILDAFMMLLLIINYQSFLGHRYNLYACKSKVCN